MPAGGERQACLTADYNAEMLEHRERFPWVRDRSVFVGHAGRRRARHVRAGAAVDPASGREGEFEFAGYVSGYTPPSDEERARLRESLGWRDDQTVCVVAVGGTAVGGDLLRRVLDAVPAARRARDGPAVRRGGGATDRPGVAAASTGATVLGYVPDLWRQLAACDVAVVQGGLTTCMELTAARRPFLYVPLRNHFEQNRHVRHRLERYGAGTPPALRAARRPRRVLRRAARTLARPVTSAPVETDGAARAARLLADLL